MRTTPTGSRLTAFCPFNTFTACSFKCTRLSQSLRCGNPLFHAGYSAFCRNKARTNRLCRMLQQIDQNMVFLAVGYNDGNALIGHLAGNGSLGQHAAPAESRFLRLYIVRKILSLLHLRITCVPGLEGEPLYMPSILLSMINACISIMEAIIPESSSLSVNISSVTEMVSFSFTIGMTPFSSITIMQLRWFR